jgi:hypothetical protein
MSNARIERMTRELRADFPQRLLDFIVGPDQAGQRIQAAVPAAARQPAVVDLSEALPRAA